MMKEKINTRRPAHKIAADLIRDIEDLTNESGYPIYLSGSKYHELVTQYIKAVRDIEPEPIRSTSIKMWYEQYASARMFGKPIRSIRKWILGDAIEHGVPTHGYVITFVDDTEYETTKDNERVQFER